MAIKDLIDSVGGIVKFCEKTGIQYTTAYRWYTGSTQINETWLILLEWALNHGFDRKLKLNSSKRVFIDTKENQ